MKQVFYFLFLATSLNSFCLNAQSAVNIDQSTPMNFYCDYNSTAGNSSARKILDILSGGGNDRGIGFHINYTQHKSIKRSVGSRYVNFNYWMDKITVASTVVYKGFNVSPYLIPTDVDVDAKGYTGSKRLFSTCWRKDIRRGMTGEMKKQYCDTMSTYQLKIEKLTFKFDYNTRSNLENYIEHIDAYEQASIQTADDMAFLNSLNLQYPDPDILGGIAVDIDHVSQHLRAIDRSGFWRELPLQRNDPLSLQTRFGRLEQHYAAKRQEVDALLARIHILYYEKGRVQYQAGQFNDAERLANAALDAEANFLPAKVLLVELAAQHNNWETAVEDAQYLLDRNAYQLDGNDKARLLSIVDQYVLALTEKGTISATANDYEQAIAWYEKGLEIIDQTVGYDKHKATLLRLRKGVANEWMAAQIQGVKTYENKANRAIESKDGEMAVEHLREGKRLLYQAWDLKETYALNATVDFEQWEYDLNKKIYQEAKTVAQFYRTEGNWNKALIYAQVAYSVVSKTDKEAAYAVLRAIQYERYLVYLVQGEAEEDHKRSIEFYEDAKELEEEFKFTAEEQKVDLDVVIKDRATKEVLRVVAMMLRSKNNNDIYNKIKELSAYAVDYKIDQDVAVIDGITQLKDWRCHNAQEDYDTYVAELKELFAGQYYKSALDVLKTMQQKNNKYRECALDTAGWANWQMEAKTCYNYQKQLAKVNITIPNNPPWDWCRRYLDKAEYLNKMYQNPIVQANFEEPKSYDLYRYLEGQQVAPLVFVGAEYYWSHQNAIAAFVLLKKSILLKGQFRGRNVAMQQQLGTTCATNDFKQGKHWKTALFDYTGDINRGIPHFDRAFKKQWLKMKRMKKKESL